MKLIDQLKAGIQLYTAQPKLIQERPVGYLTSNVKIDKLTDYFSNNYVILVKSPCQDGTPIANNVPIATLYCLERALCSYLLAHGSLYRRDNRKGLAVLNEALYKVVVLQNGREPLDYNEKFVSRLVQWLKVSEWESDFPSYMFLHTLLCKLGERFHGIPARLTSPRIAHTGYFISKHVRNPEDIHMKLQNFLILAKAIYEKIASNKFNVIEVQYGYCFRFDQVQRWYLDAEIVFGFKTDKTTETMADDLEKRFGQNKGLFRSVIDEQSFVNISNMRSLSSAPQINASSKSESVPDFSSSDDENFMKNVNTPVTDKNLVRNEVIDRNKNEGNMDSASNSKASSEPLFGSQSKSSTKDIRDSIEQFMDNWLDEATDSDINLKNSEAEKSSSQTSSNNSGKTPPRKPLTNQENTPELPKPKVSRILHSNNGSSSTVTPARPSRSKKRTRTSTPSSTKKKR